MCARAIWLLDFGWISLHGFELRPFKFRLLAARTDFKTTVTSEVSVLPVQQRQGTEWAIKSAESSWDLRHRRALEAGNASESFTRRVLQPIFEKCRLLPAELDQSLEAQCAEPPAPVPVQCKPPGRFQGAMCGERRPDHAETS